MKTKHLLLLVSCLIPVAGYAAYYEPMTCNSESVLVFTGDNCKNSQTICYTHPAYTSDGAKVIGCTKSNCSCSGGKWTEYEVGGVVKTSLGGCTCPSSSIPECYTSNDDGNSATQPYKCKSGCYGTAVYTGSSVSGCTKCPSNATCSGGNYTNFKCNSGYYAKNNQCVPCPANASCSNNSFVCNNGGYYKNGDYCAECPLSPDPSPVSGNKQVHGFAVYNSTSITSCYLMKNYPFTTNKGSYQFTQECYYKN